MRELLVVGGFTESKHVLEEVAIAAEDMQLAEVTDALTLREAKGMDEEKLRRRMAGARVLTHSAGVMAIPDARGRSSDKELPEKVIIVAGPEPRSLKKLRRVAVAKSVDHAIGPTPHNRLNHRRVLKGNIAETLAHPFVNHSLSNEISGFSTTKQLEKGAVAATIQRGNFMMSGDEFYPPVPGWSMTVVAQNLMADGFVIDELPGKHDELLVSPAGVLLDIENAFDRRDEAGVVDAIG